MTRTIFGCCLALVLGVMTVGCDSGENEIIESEPMTEADMQAADEAYDEELANEEVVGDE